MKKIVAADNHHYLLGYIELTLSMIFLSASFVISKALVETFNIFLLLGLRFLISVTIFLLIPVSRNSLLHNQPSLLFKDWLLLVGQGLCSALFNIFILYGFKTSTAIEGGLLTSTTPAITILLSYFILREEINFVKLIAITCAVVGVAIINTHGNFTFSMSSIEGNVALMLAVICGSLFAIFTKLLPPYIAPLKMTVTTNITVFIVCLPFLLVEANTFSWSTPSIGIWSMMMLYALMDSILFPLLWNKGQFKTSAGIASLFTGIMPICTTLLAIIFLKEKMYLMDILGMISIFISIYLGTNMSSSNKVFSKTVTDTVIHIQENVDTKILASEYRRKN